MKKIALSEELVLYFERFFPSFKRKKRFFKHQVLIGIGGNIGDTKKRFRNLYIFLQKDSRLHILKTSPILKNPPFGYTKQNDFFNALILLQTSLTPKELLKTLLNIEKRFGRVRSFKNAPRSLDLDIIFYDDLRLRNKRLLIPHPKWSQRDSVLIPLLYL